jgi:hypothetical protein
MDIDIDARGTNDVYIDDLILLVVKIEGSDNLLQCNRAPLLMFDMCSLPYTQTNPFHARRWRQEINLNQKLRWKRQK